MKKIILLASLAFSINAFAQVPSYVPTNGLQGWWPFSGNANDGSTNGYNGTVNGATLTSDRFGNSNNAYSFNGTNSQISYSSLFIFNQNGNGSISLWIDNDTILSNIYSTVIYSRLTNAAQNRFNIYLQPLTSNSNIRLTVDYREPNGNLHILDTTNSLLNHSWNHLVITRISNQYSLYLNGNVIDTVSDNAANLPTEIGWLLGSNGSNSLNFKGNIDDIGMWNRALTPQEITNLYNATNCENNTAINPQTNALNTGSTATFTVSTTDPNPSYVWQSNLGQGFQTLSDIENYSGTNTAILNIANVQLSEHNQPIRVISTSGECIDTSAVAYISIIDTCINNINDTTFITVTDTLIINTNITSINSPNNSNTIKVYPNPANSHITIEYGDFSLMNGYQLLIENSLGQQVFQTNITQQGDYLNLSGSV